MTSPGPPLSLDELVETVAAESKPRARRQVFLANRHLWTSATVTRLYDEVVRRVHVDIKQADRLAYGADWLAEQLGDDACRAVGLRAVGHVFFIRGKHQQARAQYNAALDIYTRLGMELEVGRTLNGSLQTLIYLGLYGEAFACAERAREIFARHGDRLRLARLDSNIGNILYRQDRFEEAVERYRRAYAEFLEVGDPLDIATVLKNTATCLISLNDFRAALEAYNLARKQCVEHAMPILVAECDYNIAYLYYLRGEYTRAIDLYRVTREHCATLGDAYHQGLCDLDQAEMYLELNLSEEGTHLARRALDTFRQLGMGYEAAKALTNVAIGVSHHGDLRSALDLFRRAKDLFRREHNHAWPAIIDLYQALVFYQDRRLREARALCEAALQFFSTSPLLAKAALCELLLARIHLDLDAPERAKEIALEALRRLEQAESPALSYQAYFVLGLIEEALDAPQAAYAAYLQAHDRMENLRSHLKAEEMKIAFLKDKLAVFESLVRMCLQGEHSLGERQRQAFAYIEQAKSRSLADLIAFRANNIPANTHSHGALMERVTELREELNWYTRAIQQMEAAAGNQRHPQIEKLRRSAREHEARLVEVMADLRVRDQEFASLEVAGSIDLEDIRSVIPEDAMLMQYYRVRDQFYVCLLTRESLKILPVGSVSTLRRVLQLLRFQLSKFRLGADYVRTFQQQLVDATNEHLCEFYEQLIEPLESELTKPHLIIAGHDFLHYLPFHALIDRQQRYLGDRFSISYTPSGSVFYLCCSKKIGESQDSLVLGVPDAAAPYIADEVKAVCEVLPNARMLLGEDVTQEVLRQDGPKSRMVHIATHGWFRQDNPMFSSISLGNSQLNLFDLYQLNLPCELVTLSGCGTGLNVVVGGDEILGLVRGLLYAGAQGILVTLWEVNDQSTAEFMRLFYSRLQQDSNKARAVQYAARELRKQYPHPFYWAPFVVVGKYL